MSKAKYIVGGIVAVIAVGAGLYFGVIQPKQKAAAIKAVYDQAKECVDAGNYAEAYELLATIPEYEETATLLTTAHEAETKGIFDGAVALLAEGKYPEGVEILSGMTDYSDAATVIEQTKYESYVYSAVAAFVAEENVTDFAVDEVNFYDFNGEPVIPGLTEEGTEAVEAATTEAEEVVEATEVEEVVEATEAEEVVEATEAEEVAEATEAEEVAEATEAVEETTEAVEVAEATEAEEIIENLSEVEKMYPGIVLHYTAKDSEGAETARYACFLFNEDTKSYTYMVSASSLSMDDLENADGIGDFFSELFAQLVIDAVTAFPEVGSVDVERVNAVVASSAYTTVSIME